MAKQRKKMTAAEFDAKFESEDIADDLDLDTAVKKVNVDFPLWMVKALDKESTRLGIPRQAAIKILIAEALEERETRKIRSIELEKLSREIEEMDRRDAESTAGRDGKGTKKHA